MGLEEVLRRLQKAREPLRDQIARLNEAIFNLDDEAEVGPGVASRIFKAAQSFQKALSDGRLGADSHPGYVALLGTLQNQPFFSQKQYATLHAWLLEALSALRTREEAGEARLRRLREENEALRLEMGRYRDLQGAVAALQGFRPPGAAAEQGSRQGRAKAEAKAEAKTEAGSKAGTPGSGQVDKVEWQVQTDFGFKPYNAQTQAAIKAAAAAGTMSCEIYCNSQYYRLDFARMLQINPLSHKERKIRVLGAEPPTPPMPKLNFRRLMAEFRQVEKAISAGQEPGLLRCEPVEDNLMEWEVDMSFPEDSPLQLSLENLAASMFDQALSHVTLCVRLPVEYPMSPPEVWLRRPRMKHQSGPVTFGGRICTLLLASTGWQPGTSMLAVFREIRASFVESGLEANNSVLTRQDYPGRPPELQRLKTELFPTVNGFCKDGMTVLSPAEAKTFLGDLARMEATDKIGLPFGCADEIYSRAEKGGTLELPLIFEVKTLLGRKTHCAIFEFIEGLPPMHVLLPKWVMEDLLVEEREPVRVRGVSLDLITFAKVQPHSVDFYQAVRDSGLEVQKLLQESLSRFSALTEDTAVPIDIGGRAFDVQVVELQPLGSVRIIDMDVQHHFEFEVDFEPAPDLEDEAATRAHQDRLLNAFRLRRERSATERQELMDRRQAARRRRFEDERKRLRAAAGPEDGTEGTVEVVLRLPSGTKLQGRFREGAPVAALAALVLSTEWAEASAPWGVHLRVFPNRALGEAEAVTRELHRAAVIVQEEQAPEADSALLAALEAGSEANGEASPAAGDVEPLAPPPLPERDEAALQARTQRAFEVQRFIRAGYGPVEAAERYAAGEVLLPTAPSVRAAPTAAPSRVPAAQPALVRSLSEDEERKRRIQEVMNFTGVEHDVAEEALKSNDWITESAVNNLLDGLVG